MSKLVSYKNIGEKAIVVTLPDPSGLKGSAIHKIIKPGVVMDFPEHIGNQYRSKSILPVGEAKKVMEPTPPPEESGSVSTETEEEKEERESNIKGKPRDPKRKRSFLEKIAGKK